jgi:hypothetical protein
MANSTSEFKNSDHDIVRILLYTTGTEHMRLNRGQADNLSGPQGLQFSYCWKDRDENITDAEIQQYGAAANYGDNIIFGSPIGQAP